MEHDLAFDSEARLAQVALSAPYLLELIHAPAHMGVRGAHVDVGSRTVVLTVVHPSLDEVRAGEPIPPLDPVFTRHATTEGAVFIEADWGRLGTTVHKVADRFLAGRVI